MSEHDYRRFYHCDCLDLDPSAEHDTRRFYHCSCISDGYASETDSDETEST